MTILKINCSIIRGGTTKGIYIERSELPTDTDLRDRAILSIFGSPDIRQINGLGGADPLSSKVVLVNKSSDKNCDVDYESGEVGIDNSTINYGTMCGNLASGVGLFAIAQGWIKKKAPSTEIKIRNVNTGKYIIAEVSSTDEKIPLVPSINIDCVPGYGAEIDLKFNNPAGAITGFLLPTGKAVNDLSSQEKIYKCSIVDCGALYAFFNANDFNLTASEVPEKLDQMNDFRRIIEELRYKVSDLINDCKGINITKNKVKIAIFSSKNESVNMGEVSLIARVINTYKTHKAYPVTGALCISAATMIDGTLLYKKSDTNKNCVKIDHPSGVIISTSSTKIVDDKIQVESASLKRSSRILIQGVSEVYV